MKVVLLAVLLAVPLMPSVVADDGLPVEVNHVDVFLPQMTGCTWSGSYKPYLTNEFVTVWHYTCDPET